MAALNGKHIQQPHFVLFPYMAQGHMIPMVDIARLLASHRVTVTIIFTPLNFQRIKPVINRAIASGLSIHVSVIKFPSTEAGLPEGCENFDAITSYGDVMKFIKGTSLMKDEVENLLKELNPSCLISDVCIPWTVDLALNLRIPRLAFHGTSCFAQVMWNVLDTSKTIQAVSSHTEFFTISELPDKIQINKAQLLGSPIQSPPGWDKIREEILDADRKAYGAVMNTFEELEPEYVKLCAELRDRKIWCIGPVSLCNQDELDKAERGNKASIDGHQCLEWLDSQKPGSVIFVCLGSLSRIAFCQLVELGLALEESNRPFVWVVRQASDEFKAWLSEESSKERVGARGLLIQGWAPQVLILSHASVGGFLTHCGWNSTLEGITAGVPMATWPVYADQFSNEKFVVNVIKTGVRVGVEMPVMFGEEEAAGVQVRSGEIRVAVDEVMDGGDEGKERRERARKLGEMAKKAMAEGGSSYANIAKLIEDVQNIST